MSKIFSDNARYSVWSYSVSHSQLLLRSVKNFNRPNTTDLLFSDVEHIDLPTLLEEITVENRDGTSEFVIKRSNGKAIGKIIAGSFTRMSHLGDYDSDSPILSGISDTRP